MGQAVMPLNWVIRSYSAGSDGELAAQALGVRPVCFHMCGMPTEPSRLMLEA